MKRRWKIDSNSVLYVTEVTIHYWKTECAETINYSSMTIYGKR